MIPVGEPIGAMNILLEEPTARVIGALARIDSQVVDGKRFNRWQGAVPRAAPVAVLFDRTGVPPWLLPSLVAFLAISLVVVLLVDNRRAAAIRRSAARS
jgi:hypothetical protein